MKLCKDCKHCYQSWADWFIMGYKHAECQRFGYRVDLITGKKYPIRSFCSTERGPKLPFMNETCGPEAKFFEAKR